MILYVKGDIFQSPAQVLVNTVNTVGVMGKGIALEFKKLFPEMFAEYRSLCETGQFQVGNLWLYKSPNKWILNFPTKRHWRQPSQMEYIEAGLEKFVNSYAQMGIHSIAFPPLGCGNGQLDFETQVQPVMEKYLRNLPIETFIYPEKESSFVEHVNVSEMEDWLRSEPQSLPFTQVWEDLQDLLKLQRNFRTLVEGSEFEASIIEDESVLQIVTPTQEHILHYDTLVEIWQQLRTYGFSMSHIAPGLDKEMSYIIPVFSELPYITPVHVADRYANFSSSQITGLQISPAAFQENESYQQLALFG